MEQQHKVLNTVIDEMDERLKFQKGEEPDAAAKCDAELDGETNKTDEVTTKIADAINEVRASHAIRDREKQQTEKQKRREEQLQFQKRQFKLKIEYVQKLERTRKANKGQTSIRLKLNR